MSSCSERLQTARPTRALLLVCESRSTWLTTAQNFRSCGGWWMVDTSILAILYAIIHRVGEQNLESWDLEWESVWNYETHNKKMVRRSIDGYVFYIIALTRAFYLCLSMPIIGLRNIFYFCHWMCPNDLASCFQSYHTWWLCSHHAVVMNSSSSR